MAAVAAKNDEFKKMGVQVLSISVDSVFVHKVWNDQEMMKMYEKGVQFPMVSDTGGNIGRLYGVYDEESNIDLRGTFIIDPDGVLQGCEVLNAGVGRFIDEAIRQIQAFQHIRETKGAEATPAGWTPGACTLTPGPQLVGNVWKEWKLPS